MSAPNTNPDKQASQHRGPLTGMAMMVLFAGVLLVGLIAALIGSIILLALINLFRRGKVR